MSDVDDLVDQLLLGVRRSKPPVAGRSRAKPKQVLTKAMECGFVCCPMDLANEDQDPCACGDCEACA